jgi:hypothetical protein
MQEEYYEVQSRLKNADLAGWKRVLRYDLSRLAAAIDRRNTAREVQKEFEWRVIKRTVIEEVVK